MLVAFCGFDDSHEFSVLRLFAVTGDGEGAAYGADFQDVRALPVRPSAMTGRCVAAPTRPLGRSLETVLERGFMLRKRRSKALQVARLLIQIERASARPWDPQRSSRLSLASRA
jgi:hypothetical protein